MLGGFAYLGGVDSADGFELWYDYEVLKVNSLIVQTTLPVEGRSGK